jgi:hypothetical protein
LVGFYSHTFRLLDIRLKAASFAVHSRYLHGKKTEKREQGSMRSEPPEKKKIGR